MKDSPALRIRFAVHSRLEARVAWMAQELLAVLADDIGEVRLVPVAEADVFEVAVDEFIVWSRWHEGRFPQLDEVMARVRAALPARSRNKS